MADGGWSEGLGGSQDAQGAAGGRSQDRRNHVKRAEKDDGRREGSDWGRAVEIQKLRDGHLCI